MLSLPQLLLCAGWRFIFFAKLIAGLNTRASAFLQYLG